MFKKTFLALCLSLFSCALYASHIEGGELRYEFNGVNYTVHLKVIVHCGGINPGAAHTIKFVAPSCNDSFYRSFDLTSIDTVREMWCDTTTTSCGVLGFPVVIIANYIDTITLDQCSDWRISANISALSAYIGNLGASPQFSPYLETQLNNSVAVNSNPYIANHPPFRIVSNAVNTIPVQAVDADGDSIVLKLKEIPLSPTTTVPFSPIFGTNYYTPTHQMGTYTNLNNSTQTLSIHNSVQSNDIMCIGVAEYRNGVLLSEYTRIWVVGTRPGTYSTDPYAAPGSNFYHTTCPGQLGIIPVSFQDSTTTDSVFLDFFPPNLNGFNFYSLSNALPGSASGMIYWTTPVNVTEAEVPYFIIRVRARNNSCPEQPYSYYGYLVDRINCVVLSPEDIYAANEGAYNRIDWNLAAGSASQYVIERGSDGINFAAIGTQAAGKESYTYWDRKPLSGTNFYRLKLENADGIVSYSKVVTAIVNTGNARITAFPNPTNDLLNISVEGSVSGEPSIYLSDLSGRTVWSATGVNTGNVEVDMKNFASGIYVIRYKDGMHNQVLKVVKQ